MTENYKPSLKCFEEGKFCQRESHFTTESHGSAKYSVNSIGFYAWHSCFSLHRESNEVITLNYASFFRLATSKFCLQFFYCLGLRKFYRNKSWNVRQFSKICIHIIISERGLKSSLRKSNCFRKHFILRCWVIISSTNYSS